MNETERLIGLLHQFTDKTEYGFEYLLDKIEAENDSGWSSETLSMIWLEKDARRLRQIADRIEGNKRRMTAAVRHLEAAE